MNNDVIKPKLALSLFLIRVGVAIVFFMWALDKFVNPEHAARVFEYFYKIPSLSEFGSYAIGTVQMVFIFAFVAGFLKRYSYALIFILHFISTASSYMRYFDPWEGSNLLFFAALPMLAGCWAIWSLREYDTLFSIDSARMKKTV